MNPSLQVEQLADACNTDLGDRLTTASADISVIFAASLVSKASVDLSGLY